MATQVREETLEETKTRTANAVAYKFRNAGELTEEQLTDPDYSLKELAKASGRTTLTCSKCHHCR